MGSEISRPSPPSVPPSCLCGTHVPLQAAGRYWLLVIALPQPACGTLQARGLNFVLSEVGPLTPSLPVRLAYLFLWQAPGTGKQGWWASPRGLWASCRQPLTAHLTSRHVQALMLL